jgi:uncharacterized protein YbjQ (UPF0145 family)
MEALLQLGVFVVLLLVGLFFGRATEKRHLADIARREAQLRDILVFNERRLPTDREFASGALVVGSVVIAEDYFKRVAAGLRSFFGGRMTVYESLLDRGRREAILRMKEDARKRGASMIFNVRFETSSLSEDRSGGSPMFSAEFIAYGTALVTR